MDTDADGLPNVVESILGTNPNNPDTDGDGIPDGAEVDQGTDPLDGLPTITGIIASAPTPGIAVDVCAINDIAVVAAGDAGVAVFNVASGQNPVRIAQVDTPGNALAVSCADRYVAVADGPAGLAVVDIADSPAARILHQLSTGALGGGNAQAVAAFGNLAFVGTDSGWLALVDLPTGALLERAQIAGRIEDLVVEGDVLYADTSDGLETFSFRDGVAQLGGAASPTPSGINAAHGRGRMFVGGGLAYLVHTRGMNVFSVTNPASPVLLLQGNEAPAQFGWKGVALNGSGLLLGAVSPNQAFDGPHNVRLYGLGAPTVFPTFITELVTPGVARAVSIYNGLAYVADGASGLQVLNYRAYDALGVPPAITLSTSFALTSSTNGMAEEGKLARVTASVTDDVQVRNVQFYVDGVRLVTDGNFPFEHQFVTSVLTTNKTNFTLRAKATDTGGNSTWSDTIVVDLVPDAPPPRVLRTLPIANTVVTQTVDTIIAYFSEPIDQATLRTSSFRLISAGSDLRLGTADDAVLSNGTVSYRDTVNAAVLAFPAPLPLGLYRGEVTMDITDVVGHHLATNFTWTFSRLAGGPDGDGLSNAEEIARGTNPFLKDTDGDGWEDGLEVEDGADPLNSNSRPQTVFVARPPLTVVLPGAVEGLGSGVTVARPPVEVVLPGAVEGLTNGVTVARPPITIQISTNSPGFGP